MLDFSGINFLTVGLVWLVYVVVGAFWYSPSGFGKLWTKYTGINIMKMPQADATNAIVAVAISAVVQAITLAVVLNSLKASSLIENLITTWLIWLGFTTATTVGVTLYSQRSWKFLWLNSSYFLLVMTIGATILNWLK